MDHKTKIGIGVLIVVILTLGIFLAIFFQEKKEVAVISNTNEIENEVQNQIENEVENETQQNGVEENKIETENKNKVEENKANSINNSTQNQVVGKEEQDSESERPKENLEEKAINLAKKAWGENSDAYQFAIVNRENMIYTVEVRSVTPSASTTIGYYTVNLETGKVENN